MSWGWKYIQVYKFMREGRFWLFLIPDDPKHLEQYIVGVQIKNKNKEKLSDCI